jgi:hypothetical protein
MTSNGILRHALSTEEALSSERVPDLVLSYVFTYHVEGHLS